MANIPQARLPVLDRDNTFTLPWLRFFQQLSTGGTIDPAIIAALEAEITNAQLTANEAIIIANEAEAAASVQPDLTIFGFLGVSALDERFAKITVTVPSFLSVTGSPVYNVGTIALSLATQAANLVFAGPTTGAAAAPTFRALVAADLPNTAVTPGSYTYTSLTVDAQGRLTAASNGTAPPAGANPTATAGPTAINGVATTYMRSDAAPAIQKGLSSQFGIVQTDGATISSTAGVIAVDLTNANTWTAAQTFNKLVTTPTTFAGLPATPVDGQRGFITDSSVTAFRTGAAAGGANHVPVYYDSGTTSWRVG